MSDARPQIEVRRQIVEAYKARFPEERREPEVLTAGPGENIATFRFAPDDADPVRRVAFCGTPADWLANPQVPPGESFVAGGADEEEAMANLLLSIQGRDSEVTVGGELWKRRILDYRDLA